MNWQPSGLNLRLLYEQCLIQVLLVEVSDLLVYEVVCKE